MEYVLEVTSLEKQYENFSVKNISFKVPKGYIMGFIGPNGAGKTTTIKTILGMLNISSGNIKLFGKDSQGMNGQFNDKIGIVMDTPYFAEDWNASDIETAVSPFYQHWNSETYASLLEKFSIDRKKKLRDLSRGMKVKLMVSVALSHHATFLVLDEPTSGLDPVAREELCDLLSEFVTDENNSVLFSTHITSDLEKIADYITFILNGEIVYTGFKDDLMENYSLAKGSLYEINEEQRKLLIGAREYSTGFEAMVKTSDIRKLPNELLTEPITLDEIIVFMNKEGKTDE